VCGLQTKRRIAVLESELEKCEERADNAQRSVSTSYVCS